MEDQFFEDINDEMNDDWSEIYQIINKEYDFFNDNFLVQAQQDYFLVMTDNNRISNQGFYSTDTGGNPVNTLQN